MLSKFKTFDLSTSYRLWFKLLIALNLLIVWTAPFFSTEDGPEHIAIAATIKNLLLGHCPNISALYHFTHSPVPTWIANFLIIPMLGIFSPWIIEKIMFSLVILTFSLSIFIFLRSISRINSWFIIPIMLFTFNYVAYMGGYNFMFSTALYFLGLRWWMLRGKTRNTRNFLTLMMFETLLYFFHLFGLAVFVLSIGALEIHKLVQEKSLKTFAQRSLYYFFSAIPILVLSYYYFILPKMQMQGVIPMAERILHLIVPILLSTISDADYYLLLISTIAFWALFALVGVKYIKTRGGNSQLFYIIIILAICMLLTPATFAGGWVIEPRLQLYIFVIALLYAATFTFSNLQRNIIIIISLSLNFYILTTKYIELPKYGKILASYDQIQEHLPDNINYLSVDISPFTIDYDTNKENLRFAIPNTSGFITAQKTCAAQVNDRSMAEKNSFPVTYYDDKNPNYVLGKARTEYGLGLIPPQVNIAEYEKSTGQKIDYVIIRGSSKHLFHYPPEHQLDENKLYEAFMQEITSHFDISYESGDGMIKIYKAKN